MLFAAWLLVAVAVAMGQQPAPAKELVAVMDLESIGATKAQISACSERLREELLQTNRFRLIDRNEMAKVLDEQALQQSGCTSQECMVQVGKVLGVRRLITGRVTKVEDDLWMISGTLLDVESAETLRVSSVQHDGNFRTLLGPGIAALAAKLLVAPGGSAPIPARATAAPPAATAAAPAAAPAPTAALAPRPPARTGPRLAIAVFPMSYSECTLGMSTCGPLLFERHFTELLDSALKGVDQVIVTKSAYPQAIPGAALETDASFTNAIWSGVFSKAPVPEVVIRKGKELGVEAVLMVAARHDYRTVTMDAFLVDVSKGRVLNRKFNSNRDGSGRANQEEITREFVELFGSLVVRPKLAAGELHSFAVLPLHFSQCLGNLASCGAVMYESDFAGIAAKALKSVAAITIAKSYYPDAIPGGSLREDAALASGTWTGTFAKSPNTALLAQKGQQMGVDGIFLAIPRYDATTISFSIFLIDTKTQRVFNHRFDARRDNTGRTNQEEVNRQFAIAFGNFAGGS
jgi:TolB-like protein